MRIKFWGTRGSVAKPGPSTVRYGGNTSCVQITSNSGTQLIIDCGTGAHGLGQQLLAQAGKNAITAHLLISHTHWDHIQGFPFFTPLFIPGNHFDVYAPKGFGESLRETLAGQMSYTYFPVAIDALGADIHYHDLVEGSFEIGDIRVHTRYLNHPALTLGFRIEVDGATLVYACDHEPHDCGAAVGTGPLSANDRSHAEFLTDADMVIHDAQYTASEYSAKIGWGHSTIEYAMEVCRIARVKRLAFTHHDPLRTDDDIDNIIAGLDMPAGLEVFAASEGPEIELSNPLAPPDSRTPMNTSAVQYISTPDLQSVLLAMPDSAHSQLLINAIEADGLCLTHCKNSAELEQHFKADQPAMVIVADDFAEDITAVARHIRQSSAGGSDTVPVIAMVTNARPVPTDKAITDQLIAPFSVEYARTRVRAWLLKLACRWQRAEKPHDEAQRIATLEELCLLDSVPEERFDRITRLTATLFDVPVALVTLVDHERQWFKSAIGTDLCESNRDLSFCAHAILTAEPLVIPDTLADDRFADNPMVSGPPRIRFYAGQPLSVNGFRMGTLCIIDFRPREMSATDLERLADLGALVEREFNLALPVQASQVKVT